MVPQKGNINFDNYPCEGLLFAGHGPLQGLLFAASCAVGRSSARVYKEFKGLGFKGLGLGFGGLGVEGFSYLEVHG